MHIGKSSLPTHNVKCIDCGQIWEFTDAMTMFPQLCPKCNSGNHKELSEKETGIKDCLHDEVDVSPSLDTIYGLADEYTVECAKCGKVLIEDATRVTANNFIADGNLRVQLGAQYL